MATHYCTVLTTTSLVSYNVYKTLQHVLSPEKGNMTLSVLISLHWLPVHYRCHYKPLIYVYKAQHGKAPSYLQELITPHKPNRALRSENSMLCILQTMSERKATVRGVLTKPRLHSGTVYLCHWGTWILWTSLKKNLRLTFLELLLRISCRFLVVFRIFDFFKAYDFEIPF